MVHQFEYILLFVAGLLIISIMSGRFFSRFGFSSLLITLCIGLLFGNGGKYDFDYNNPGVTLRISEIALCFILFSGGLGTHWSRSRSILLPGLLLSVGGTLLTAITLGAGIHFLLGWPWMLSVLMGAIVSSTDAAAVFSILESSGLKLKNGLSDTLEFESGTNDPMAYFLTFSLTTMLTMPEQPWKEMLWNFLVNMSIGAFTGYLAGRGATWMMLRAQLKRGESAVVYIGVVLLLYALNVIAGGSALLAMYIAGIVIGNTPDLNREESENFFTSFNWLMETILFLVLGFQLYLQDLKFAIWDGLIISGMLMFIARPLGVIIGLVPVAQYKLREKVFLSWVGLRGATPIVFALIPVVHQVQQSVQLFNISFVIVLTSILLQGNTVGQVAGWLKVKETEG